MWYNPICFINSMNNPSLIEKLKFTQFSMQRLNQIFRHI
jgi:hypothetical protein